jgi:hypothetical protein
MFQIDLNILTIKKQLQSIFYEHFIFIFIIIIIYMIVKKILLKFKYIFTIVFKNYIKTEKQMNIVIFLSVKKNKEKKL